MKQPAVHAHTLSTLPTWLHIHQRQPHVPIFASDKWLCIIENAFGFQAQVLTAATRSGVEAAVPLLGRQRFFLRVSPPPPITLYNGFQSIHRQDAENPDAELPAAAAAILGAIATRYHFVSLALPIDCEVIDVFRKHRWELTARQTIRIDMPDFDTVWKGYSQSLRRKIRRAEEHQLRMVETNDAGAVASMYSLSYERHAKHPPIPASVVCAWLRALSEQRIARMYTAVLPGGAILAARAVIPDHDTVYDWLAGADLAAADISASHWLVSAIQRRFAEEGFRTFDFMGANTPGIVDFKRSFGGETVPYHIATYYRSPMIKTVESLRNNIRRRKRATR
jgi:hypothetical protein